MKRPKSGFNLKVDNVRLDVYFKEFNKRVVVCWMKDGVLNKTFVGRAKCNKELDTYDAKIGRELSLERAINKRNCTLEKRKDKLSNALRIVKTVVNSAVKKKHVKLEGEGKIKCDGGLTPPSPW